MTSRPHIAQKRLKDTHTEPEYQLGYGEAYDSHGTQETEHQPYLNQEDHSPRAFPSGFFQTRPRKSDRSDRSSEQFSDYHPGIIQTAEPQPRGFGRALPYILARGEMTEPRLDVEWEERRSFSYNGSVDPCSSSDSGRGHGYASDEGYKLDLTLEPDEGITQERVLGLVKWLLISFNKFRSHATGAGAGRGATQSSKGKNNEGKSNETLSITSMANLDHTRSEPQQKRERGSDDGGDGDDPEHYKCRRLAQKRRKQDPALACPFFKFNRLEHASCGNHILKGISRVTQHIYRSHRVPIHCSSCFQEFEDDEARGEHERQRTCIPIPPITWKGRISSKKREEIRDVVRKNKSAEENWFVVFACLFPDAMLPDNPYPDIVDSKEMSDCRAFVASEAFNVVDEYIEHNERYDPGILDVDPRRLLQGAIPHCLNRLFDGFDAAQSPPTQGATESTASAFNVNQLGVKHVLPRSLSLKLANLEFCNNHHLIIRTQILLREGF